MAQTISCPECDKALQVRALLGAGAKLRCPGCQTVFPVAADDRPRPRKKSKKQGGNLGLILGLSVGGGFLLIALVVVIVVVVINQNGPGGGPAKDVRKQPGEPKQEDAATGKVPGRFPPNVLKQFNLDDSLAQVEAKLGARGKLLPPSQWPADLEKLVQLNPDPNQVCYHWSDAAGANLYLIMLNGKRSGGMFKDGSGVNPVGGDKVVQGDQNPPPEKIVPIPAGRIPPNILDKFKTKYDKNYTTLAQVEARLRRPGILVPRAQLPPEVEAIVKLGQPGTNESYYLWVGGGDRLYLFFDNGVYNGGRLLPRELYPEFVGDKTGPGPGPVQKAVISRDFLNQIKPRGNPQPTTMTDVEQMLGFKGKRLSKVITEVANVLGQPNKMVAAYVWTQGTNRLYLYFENGSGIYLAGYYKGK